MEANFVKKIGEFTPEFLDGISKVFAATGVRVGWALGPSIIIDKMKAILTHLGAWAPMAEQKAVARFLLQKENIDAYLAHFKAEVEESDPECAKILFDNLLLLDVESETGLSRVTGDVRMLSGPCRVGRSAIANDPTT